MPLRADDYFLPHLEAPDEMILVTMVQYCAPTDWKARRLMNYVKSSPAYFSTYPLMQSGDVQFRMCRVLDLGGRERHARASIPGCRHPGYLC